MRLALQAGLRVYVLNAQDVFFYAKALGSSGKTDRTDAQVIARYAAEHCQKLRPWSPGTASQQRILELIRRRSSVTTHRVALRQLLGELPTLKLALHQLELQLAHVLAEIDRQIQKEVQADAQLRRAVRCCRRLLASTA